ncbi:MAG TPA: carboxypeptidase regulatory-like domain-containing protein [Vicinamibacterales bacterium]|nr:carboxypeptidase regulatory-like domain-containing protein [Vicinamibacterales bacterium]
MKKQRAWRQRLTLGLAVAAACLLGLPAAAQTITTGNIGGDVKDQQGGALPGVVVLATHVDTGTTYQTVTQATGRYVILNVRTGSYTVKASLSGFKDKELKDVIVTLGGDTAANFELELAARSETVEVTAVSTPIDLTQAGVAGHISNQVKEVLPTISRSITDIVRTNVYFNPMGLNDDTPVAAVAGRSQRFNSFQIDGAVNNDLFGLAAGGGTPGGNAATQPISLDAIKEIQLLVSPYDVRQSGFSGGGINAITKSGTNELHGTAFFFGRNQSMVGDGVTHTPISTFSDYQGGFSLGGKIVQNKAFYFGTLDNERKKTPSGFSVGGTGVDFGNQALVDQFLNDLKNLYHYDLGANAKDEYPKETHSNKIFVRGDFNLGTQNQLVVRHNYVDAFSDIGTPSTTLYVFPDAFYRFDSTTNSTVGQLTSRLGSGVNEFRLALTRVNEKRVPLPGYETNFPNVTVNLNGTSSLQGRAGREQFSGANQLDQDIVELTDDFTHIRGSHQFTIGTHNEFFKFRNLFIRDFYGTYTFNSLQLFEQGLAQGFSHSFSATSDPLQPAEFHVNHMGFYAGDQWHAQPRLTLTYGIRADFVRYPDTPHANPAAEAAFGYRTDVVPNNTLWSPRIGFNWARNAAGTEQVRGGVGLFAGRTPYVWISNQYGNTGIDFTRISVSGSGNRIPFIPDPNNQYTSPSQITGATAGIASNEIDLIDPNFKYPSVVRMNLGYDRQLPMGWYGTAEFLYSSTVNDIKYQNLNYVQVSTSNLDGRPIYTRKVPSLSDTLLLTNTNDGSAWTISFEAKRPFAHGVFVDVAYLYGQSKTVMDGTRDQAISVWNSVYTPGDPNNPPLTTSDYDPGHRINITGTYDVPFGKGYSATVSLFYSGQSGRPYTVLWSANSPSVNGDNQNFNDNIFLMNTAPAGVTFTNGTFQDLLNYFQSNSCTANQLGQIMERNTCRAPWTNTLDARFAFNIPVKKVNAQFTVDILNLLNLLNSSWGVFKYANFNDVTPASVTLNAAGQITNINLSTLNSSTFSTFTRGDLRSRWQLQLGGRIRF